MSGWANHTPGAPWGDSRASLARDVRGAARDSSSRCQLEPVEVRAVRDHRFAGEVPEGLKRKRCGRCGQARSHMDHWGAPPSLNVHGSGANRFVYQNLKKAWQDRLRGLLAATRLPRGLGGVTVEGRMCFPDRGRRDQGNFRFLIEKALGDALVEGGWLEDDDWTRYEFGGLAHEYERGESWTQLVLFPRWGEEEPPS